MEGSMSNLEASTSKMGGSVTSINSSRRGSASFLMFKDLETKDEFQKVRMASFLRELHRLAVEETKEMVREEITRKTSERMKDGSINFEDLEGDLSSGGLTPALALAKIDALLRKGETFDSNSLIKLFTAAKDIMGEEDTVIDLREYVPGLQRVSVVGDIHGSLNCLLSVLELIQIEQLTSDKDRVVVFDGDFVDRGMHSLEVLSTLLLLKISHPQQVVLLRGNHEDSMTASTYGFRDEIESKYDYDAADEIWYECGPLFASFPIIARSGKAAIMHGGIPFEDFSLRKANRLEKEIRCQLKTITDPYDDDEKLVQGILWSDPSDLPGFNESDRGAGVTFGPDVAKEFLDSEKLKYIIRAHEPFEDGTNFLDVGGGKGVITIFSTANYPDGEGSNNGAVLLLDDGTGEFETPSFIHKVREEGASSSGYEAWLTSIIEGNKSKLVQAFEEVENDNGHVTADQWAGIMSFHLDLPDVPWIDIQEELAPSLYANMLSWKPFIERFTTKSTTLETDQLSKDQMSLLQDHHGKFLDIFNLLDTDGSGTVSQEEFVSGVQMLEEQLDGEVNIDDPAKLYKSLDVDGDGELSIEEFCRALKESKSMKSVAESLNKGDVEILKQNNEMLHLAFKYLDTDRSGGIDRDEFQRGIDLLNKRLPERSRLGDPQKLFDVLDLDGNGEIDMNEFNTMFR